MSNQKLYAVVRHDLHGVLLGFSLEERNGTYLWRELGGAFHGSTYTSAQAAIRGLQLMYTEPGAVVEFRKDEAGDRGLSIAA
jgi:hypothetical protein